MKSHFRDCCHRWKAAPICIEEQEISNSIHANMNQASMDDSTLCSFMFKTRYHYLFLLLIIFFEVTMFILEILKPILFLHLKLPEKILSSVWLPWNYNILMSSMTNQTEEILSHCSSLLSSCQVLSFFSQWTNPSVDSC